MATHYRIIHEMDGDLRRLLLEYHRLINLPAKHQLLFDSDYGQDVYLVESGILKARKLNLQGDEIVIALMGPGALIGDLAMLSPKPLRTADVVSLTPTTLLKLRHGVVGEAFEGSPMFVRGIASLQAQRLCSLGERLMLMNDDAMTRLLATLFELARLNGPEDDPYQPIPAIPQQEIAVIAGLSRGTASTLINKLRANGTLEETDHGLRFGKLAPLQRRGLLAEAIPTPTRS